MARLILARAAAGLSDATITCDVVNVEQIRAWFGRPLWEMESADADTYFGTVLRSAAKGTRHARSRALRVYFLFLEIRHKVEIHQLTGRVVQCPIDEMNRPRCAGGRPCGSRPRPNRSRRCSPGGVRIWGPAGSSPRRPVTMRRPG